MCRKAILDALSPLAVGKDSGVAGGEGAIYFWAKLPQGAPQPHLDPIKKDLFLFFHFFGFVSFLLEQFIMIPHMCILRVFSVLQASVCCFLPSHFLMTSSWWCTSSACAVSTLAHARQSHGSTHAVGSSNVASSL